LAHGKCVCDTTLRSALHTFSSLFSPTIWFLQLPPRHTPIIIGLFGLFLGLLALGRRDDLDVRVCDCHCIRETSYCMPTDPVKHISAHALRQIYNAFRSRTSGHAPSIPCAYDASAAFSKPLRSILFGLSIGRPSARSQISCASGPRPLLTPKMAV